MNEDRLENLSDIVKWLPSPETLDRIILAQAALIEVIIQFRANIESIERIREAVRDVQSLERGAGELGASQLSEEINRVSRGFGDIMSLEEISPLLDSLEDTARQLTSIPRSLEQLSRVLGRYDLYLFYDEE